jgi:hypothetical protein
MRGSREKLAERLGDTEAEPPADIGTPSISATILPDNQKPHPDPGAAQDGAREEDTRRNVRRVG